jgi:hypothetical protein
MGSILLQGIYKPMYQAIACVLVLLILYVIFRPNDEERVWVLAGVTYLLFILLNAVMLWFVPAHWTYFFMSLLISVAYLFVANLIVTGYTSSFNVKGSGESSMIFLVIIYHPFVLLLVIFAKWLYLKFI